MNRQVFLVNKLFTFISESRFPYILDYEEIKKLRNEPIRRF